jgi:zinc and cadmium transporter
MASYFDVIFFSLIGGLFSLAGGVLLLSRQRAAEISARYATPFAAGALLAAVFLDLLKEGVEIDSSQYVLLATLMGILIFFFAERFLRWFHHHHEDEDEKKDPAVPLIIAGDTLHNALDGVVIASAFLISVPTGIVTTLAVAAHEIPQEIGDFGLLLSKGVKRGKVLLFNIVSALATTAMAVITFALGSQDKLPVGLLLGISAGFLLYIAMSDIIPTIHQTSTNKSLLQIQSVLLAFGALVVAVAIQLSHQYTGG